MKLTTIQLYERTRINLERRKIHKRESYDTVIQRILERDAIPSMRKMFEIGDALKQDREYGTEEIIAISHGFRGKKWRSS